METDNELYAGFFDVKSYEELENEIDKSAISGKYLIIGTAASFSVLLLMGKFN